MRSYNASLTVELSPSAAGQYIVVYTDAPQPTVQTPYNVVDEVSETNNLKAVAIDRDAGTGRPGRHECLDSDRELLGREHDVQLHGRERRDRTRSGRERPTGQISSGFRPSRPSTDFDASFLGQTTHAQSTPLLPGQSYTINFTVTLPAGTGGQYYLYIDLDAHNDLPPNLYLYQARLETTDWWPADTGDNSFWLSQFNHWAFEDPNNNRMATAFDITYREPDLTVTNITVPANVISGSTVPITYTVTNRGTRATRTASWPDRIFLSEDPSLDIV